MEKLVTYEPPTERQLTEVEEWVTTEDQPTEEAYKDRAFHLCYEAGLDSTQTSFLLRLLLEAYTPIDYDTLVNNLKGYKPINKDELERIAKSSNIKLQPFFEGNEPVQHIAEQGYVYNGTDLFDLYPEFVPINDTNAEVHSEAEEEIDIIPTEEIITEIVLVQNKTREKKTNRKPRSKNRQYSNRPDSSLEYTAKEFYDTLKAHGLSNEEIKLLRLLEHGYTSSTELTQLFYDKKVGSTALSRRMVYLKTKLEQNNIPILIHSRPHYGYRYIGPKIKKEK